MQHVKLIIGVVLLFLLAIFTVQNASVVTISFFFWEFTISRALMIFLVLAIGIVVGIILANFIRPRHRQ